MSSERLEEYEDNLKSLLRDLETQVSITLPAVTGEELRKTLQRAERNLDSAEKEFAGFQTEIRKAPQSYQQHYNLSIGRYRNQLSSIKRQLVTYSTTSARQDLLYQSEDGDPFGSTGDPQYDQLLKNTETLNRASSSLANAQKVSAETDIIADDIVENLAGQKQSLLRTRNRVQGFDHQMDQSRNLMRKIACQSIQNRLILVAVIIIEILVLIILIWWKFFSK